jgi:hypothetical protein
MMTERLNHLSGRDLGAYRSLQTQIDTVEQRIAQGGGKLSQSEKNVIGRWREIRDRLGVDPATATDREILDASRGHWQNQLGAKFAERPYLHLRLARGAQFVDQPGESVGLAARRKAVVEGEREFARVEQKVAKSQEDLIAQEAGKYLPPEQGGKPLQVAERPRTFEEAQARVGAIDQQYNKLVDSLAQKMGHPGYGTSLAGKEAKAETAFRNRQRAAFRRQQAGQTRLGRMSGAAGEIVPFAPKTLAEERRLAAEQHLNRLLETSTNPELVRLRELLAERDQLAGEIGTQQERAVGGEVPGAGSFGTVPRRSRVVPRPGELSTPEEFAPQAVGRRVLTYDNRLLTPAHVNELERYGGALSRARDKLEIAEKRWLTQHGHLPQGLSQAEKNTLYDAVRHRLPEPGFTGDTVLQGGPTVEQLRAELDAGGRAQPFYHPDIIAQNEPSLQARGAGKGVPGPDARLKRNLGHVFASGALYAHPDALSIAHLGLAKQVLAHAIHDQLLQDGVRIGADQGVPKGWEYIRSNLDQPISQLAKTEGETLDYLQGGGGKLDFTTANPKEALLDGEYRVIVPKAYVNRLAGEFTRSDSAIRALFTKPTNVWRAIVLGLRPGFFTNNAVGNYLLYGLRHHGWASVQAWMSMLREAGATKALDELGRDQTFRRMAMKNIPETYTNTYARTAFEGVPGARVLRRLQHGIGPLTARVAEEIPRELIAREDVIREAKRLGIKIPKQAQEFNRLSDEILSRPEMATRTVEEANTTLGDYLHYSPFESQIRQLVPFYGWLRAITRITAHTALNTPGRALLLTKLGQLALQENETQYGPLPDYLRSMLPLSGVNRGNVWALSQSGLDPFSTIGQLAQAAGVILAGNPGEGAKAMADIGVNPFITGLYEWMSGKSAYSGVRLKPQKIAGVRLPGLLGYELGATGSALPPINVLRGLTGHAYKSRVYANQNDWWKALAQWAGAPVANVNLPAANRTARLQGHP